MQKTLTGDALLAGDVRYIVPAGGHLAHRGSRTKAPKGESYLAYPSAATPRFLIPLHDSLGQRFVLRMLSVDKGAAGALLRTLLRFPGGLALARFFIFKECVVVSHD